MIPLDLIREFVNNEIPFIESKQTLHDVFYLILKDHGIAYQKMRKAWIDYDSRQLDLFNGDH
jgi:hypothetical protein